MKKLFWLFLSLLSACQWTQISPQNQLNNAFALQNSQIQKALIGIYDQVQEIENQRLVLAELQEQSLKNTNLSDLEKEIFDKKVRTTNLLVENFWKNSYKAIAQTNLVLEESSQIKDSLRANQTKGETLFLRAYLHFSLSQFFANPDLAVPYVKNTELYPKRDSLLVFYKNIENDLQKALVLLKKEDFNKNYANFWAAKMLLAKLYFVQKNYTACLAQSQDLLSSPFSLNSSPTNAFQNESEKEVIWQLANTATDLSSQAIAAFYAKTLANSPVFDVRDKRLVFLENNKILKYQNAVGLPIFRFSELILLHAYALNQTQADFREVRNYVNLVRTRANLAANNAASSSERLNELILDEYKKELVWEGKVFAFFGKAYPLPIPQREMGLNPTLVQNSGY